MSEPMNAIGGPEGRKKQMISLRGAEGRKIRWPWLIAAMLVLASAHTVRAISILKSFQGDPTDGRYCQSSLVSDGSGALYGTTYQGGRFDKGLVFKISADGTGFTILHQFAGWPSDGEGPTGPLALDAAGNVYGSTWLGGVANEGTVFTIKTDGTAFGVLRTFEWSSGAYPSAVALDGAGNLYGTTGDGGTHGLGTVFAMKVDGSGYLVLHHFAGYQYPSGPLEGAYPFDNVILDGAGTIYGTTSGGGAQNAGTVFKLSTDGTGFSVLHNFNKYMEGGFPYASLVLDGAGNLYGAAYNNRSVPAAGSVYTIKTDGTGFTVLHSFAGGATDGAYPRGTLVLDTSGNLYGTTEHGGAADQGTVFTLKTDGSGYALLHQFAGGSTDGANPYVALSLDPSGKLYGSTYYGGGLNEGTLFKLGNDGTGFGMLHSFGWVAAGGAFPSAALVFGESGNLYGTTFDGGAFSYGTVFTLNSDGTGFCVLHSFAGGASDGASPAAAVVADGAGNLYGTTQYGGASNLGTVFTLKTDGTGFSVLHSFAGAASDGNGPLAPLFLDGAGNLFGTTYNGGASDVGSLFKLGIDGNGFLLLHSFGGTEGMYPNAALVEDGAGYLYGTTGWGSDGNGTVFRVKTDGTGLAVLASIPYFIWVPGNSSLVLDHGGNLYGTAYGGGQYKKGAVFTLKTDGSGFTSLHDFAGAPSDGDSPWEGLAFDNSGNLYGTTISGGQANQGAIFTLKTDGSGFSLLHSFAGAAFDGSSPRAELVLDGSGTLYGTTYQGGTSDLGTVFALPVTGDQPPAITSASSTTFTVGVPGTFTVATTGYPIPTIGESGSLPSGVTFTDNGDGTATLAGTPAIGAGGTYPLVITAHNGVGYDATQNFTLTVNLAVSPGAKYHPLPLCRLVDTRHGPKDVEAPEGGRPPGYPRGQYTTGETRSYDLTKSAACTGLPGGVTAWSLLFQFTTQGGSGVPSFLVAWPYVSAGGVGGQTPPKGESTMLGYADRWTANSAIIPGGNDANGSINVHAQNAGDVIIEINGYFK